MNTRCFPTVLLTLSVLLSGCPQTIEVEESARRPDAAVVTLPPRMACTHEIREVGSLTVEDEGAAPVDLVRWREGALMVRTEPAKQGAAAGLKIDRVGRNGALEGSGTTSKTGPAGPILALDALVARESLLVALTRSEGRIDVLTLGVDGSETAPVKTIESGREGAARILWFRGVPLVAVAGTILHTDGSSFQLAAGQPDAGVRSVPPEFLQVVTAGKTLGWLRRAESGYRLEHYHDDETGVLSLEIAAPSSSAPRMHWAGDRYLVGDPPRADIGRYIVARARQGKGGGATQLRLGGRIALPHPRGQVSSWSWNSAGPAHLGLAQVMGTRHLQFVNVALAGQVLDAAVQLRRERDILSTHVAWDGSGYVLAWSEREEGTGAQLLLTRFTCPDDD